jgi:hypothetical protein
MNKYIPIFECCYAIFNFEMTITEKRGILTGFATTFRFLFFTNGGIIAAALYLMYESDTNRRIRELESQLVSEEEKYINAVRSHKDYNTLRAHRENMHHMKTQLEQLYNSRDSIANS